MPEHVIFSYDIALPPPSAVAPYRERTGTAMAVNKYDSYILCSFPVNMISGRNLFRSLLLHPASERSGSNGEPVDLVHHPQIALLCSLLTDTDRRGPEVRPFRICLYQLVSLLRSYDRQTN